jgi:hypothetical protein
MAPSGLSSASQEANVNYSLRVKSGRFSGSAKCPLCANSGHWMACGAGRAKPVPQCAQSAVRIAFLAGASSIAGFDADTSL